MRVSTVSGTPLVGESANHARPEMRAISAGEITKSRSAAWGGLGRYRRDHKVEIRRLGGVGVGLGAWFGAGLGVRVRVGVKGWGWG